MQNKQNFERGLFSTVCFTSIFFSGIHLTEYINIAAGGLIAAKNILLEQLFKMYTHAFLWNVETQTYFNHYNINKMLFINSESNKQQIHAIQCYYTF